MNVTQIIENHTPLYICKGLLCCFQFGAVVNEGPENMLMNICLWPSAVRWVTLLSSLTYSNSLSAYSNEFSSCTVVLSV